MVTSYLLWDVQTDLQTERHATAVDNWLADIVSTDWSP